MCRENVVFTCAHGKRQSDLGDTLAYHPGRTVFAVDGIGKLVTYSATHVREDGTHKREV